jgi:hypothetical protein
MKKSIFLCGRLSEPHAEVTLFLHADLLRGPYQFFHTGVLRSRMRKWRSICTDVTSYGPHVKMMGPRTEKSLLQ